MDALRKAGDSCGARIEVRAHGVPVGLGEPLFDKLDADIAWAMMGINAVKGVEIGDGFGVVAQRGSEHGDELTPAGLSAATMPAACWAASAPGRTWWCASRSSRPARSACPRRRSTAPAQPTTVETLGRHDPCVGIRATPIAEAMLALVLMDHVLRHRAQCADVQLPLPPIPGRPAGP
jgi:chorismate synthase